jgi:serralysin
MKPSLRSIQATLAAFAMLTSTLAGPAAQAGEHRSLYKAPPIMKHGQTAGKRKRTTTSAGLRGGSGPNFGIVSLNSAGDLHDPFGGDGIVGTSFSGYTSSEIRAGDESGFGIIMGGYAVDADDDRLKWALAKYTSTGALDDSFSGDGRVVTPWVNVDYTYINDLKVYGGKIFAAGVALVEGNYRFAVAKYSATTGALEASVYVTFPGWNSAQATGIDVANSEVIVAGIVGPDNITPQRIALAKLSTANLALVPSFGVGGRQVYNIASDEGLTGLALDTSFIPYRIAVGGHATYGAAGRKFWVARYTSSGAVDASFGGGLVVTNFSGSNEGINDIAVKDGKVVAVGWYAPAASTSSFAVARYNTNGTLDAACDGNGLKGISFTGNYAVATQVSWGASRISIAGWREEPDGSGYDFAAAMLFGNDCSLDDGFDGNGLRVVDVSAYDDVSALVSDSFMYLGGQF